MCGRLLPVSQAIALSSEMRLSVLLSPMLLRGEASCGRGRPGSSLAVWQRTTGCGMTNWHIVAAAIILAAFLAGGLYHPVSVHEPMGHI
jgi:hypothetical protein